MDWPQAFARQACSDFETRDLLLQQPGLPQCHQLHYLQMALEKVAKAHYMARGDSPAVLQRSHGYIAKGIKIIVQDALARTPGSKPGWIIDAVLPLLRRIELLAPAVDAGGTVPSNCEYPWQEPTGNIVVPVMHDFRIGLQERAAATMLKVVRKRANELAQADSVERP